MTALPPLPYAEWEPTRTTLHLWVQIVGKVRLASARFFDGFYATAADAAGWNRAALASS